jgi:hypothetical protein
MSDYVQGRISAYGYFAKYLEQARALDSEA